MAKLVKSGHIATFFVLFFMLFPAVFAMDPARISATPTITSDLTPTLSFNKTYPGICRGNLDEDKDFSDMEFAFEGEENSHSYTFTSDLSYLAYTVYVKCLDAQGEGMFPGYYFDFVIIPEEYNPNNLPPTGVPENLDGETSSPTGFAVLNMESIGLLGIIVVLIGIGTYIAIKRRSKG